MRKPIRAHLGHMLWLLGAVIPTWGCIVTSPSPREVLDYGFNTPIQTFQSFVVALRADLPHHEYRCFSSGFKARNEISRTGYLLFRDELLKEQPLLRWALERASRKPERYQMEWGSNGQQVRLTVDVQGRPLHVILKRESYVTVLGKPENHLDPADTWIDEPVGDLQSQMYLFLLPGGEALGAKVPNPHRDLDDFVSLTVGREWKIEDIYLASEARP